MGEGVAVARGGTERRAAADAGALARGPGLRAERLPDPRVEVAPGGDLGAHLRAPPLERVDQRLLLPDLVAERLHLVDLAPERDVVAVDRAEGENREGGEDERRRGDPAWDVEAEDAPAVAPEEEEVEAPGLAHDRRLNGTTDACRRISGGPGLAIRQCPSKRTPSSTTTTGAFTSPKTRTLVDEGAELAPEG